MSYLDYSIHRLFQILTTTFLCAIAVVGASYAAEQPLMKIGIGDTHIQATVANTDATRIRGLLGWSSITDEQGMLLDFLVPGEYAIHMQGMKFPIDAVWIDTHGEIKVIYPSIAPNSGMVYPSMFPVRYCLELNAGFCKRHNVQMGRKVEFDK